MDSWNEGSRRYVTQEPEFYIPAGDEWRSTPENKKQGSGPAIDIEAGAEWTRQLEQYCTLGESHYKAAMEAGLAAEQARLFLPAYGMYVNYRWSCSFQSLILFLNQRLEEDSQKEIQEYAKAAYLLAKDIYPVSLELLLNKDLI
jgi:thymidylate synthase (FAD)